MILFNSLLDITFLYISNHIIQITLAIALIVFIFKSTVTYRNSYLFIPSDKAKQCFTIKETRKGGYFNLYIKRTILGISFKSPLYDLEFARSECLVEMFPDKKKFYTYDNALEEAEEIADIASKKMIDINLTNL